MGIERALAAWGPHVGLLISRHGGRIYRRFGLPHAKPADAAAIHAYLDAQTPLEAEWAAAAGLDEKELERQSGLIGFVDALSLLVCGALRAPARFELPGVGAIQASEASAWDFRFSPWPFQGGPFEIEGLGRRLPDSGVFTDEMEMRAWIAAPTLERFATRLAPA